MKELSTKEKAKRYDVVVKKAETLYKAAEPMSGCNVIIETLFPELAESEDEKIKKALIEMVHDTTGDELWVDYNVHKEDALALLEKQGEQKLADDLTAQKAMDIAVQKCFEQGKTALEAVKEEKADNQNCVKPAKVEPKFKVGDWINGYYTNYKVLSVNNDGYLVEDVDGNKINILFENEKFHHLWTIQDAKDGDVLHCWIDGDEFVLIYKGIRDGYITTYGHLYQKFKSFSEEPTSMFCRTIQGHFTPATKEQRDTLMRAMADAGYTFDFEKKELKKIEQKPVDKVEPIEGEFPYNNPADTLEGEIDNIWKKLSCNNRFSATKEGFEEVIRHFIDFVGQKPVWSEEDEKKLNYLIAFLQNITMTNNALSATNEGIEEWLKSLKSIRPQQKQEILEKLEEWIDEYVSDLADVDTASLIGSFTNYLDGKLPVKPKNRWKPSDIQLKELLFIIGYLKHIRNYKSANILHDIYEQLIEL